MRPWGCAMSRFAAAMVLGLLLSGVARADVTLTIWAGAGGHVRQGAMAPVMVQVKNDNHDRNAVLRAGFHGMANEPLVWAEQAVTLPPNSQKRIFLYVPLQAVEYNIRVRLETPQGR